ncbi:hypothetical protein [Streptomyces sp. NPDC051704]|uniref:hypothetical protein n=1 Tax=Streptomyces sp. NPDC051704 TaxID=3365671 RepID=UPI003789936E
MSTDNQENPSGPEFHDPSAMWRALTRLHAATVTSHDFTDYIRHIGDRTDLFLAVAAHTGDRRAIYPGSYLDLTPSSGRARRHPAGAAWLHPVRRPATVRAPVVARSGRRRA